MRSEKRNPDEHGELYLGLVVVLDAHGEDVDADDEGDEKVQVVAGAQSVDGEAHRRVVGVVGSLLGLWGAQTYQAYTLEKGGLGGGGGRRWSTQTARGGPRGGELASTDKE